MEKQVYSRIRLFFFLLLFISHFGVEAQTCKPIVKIKGKRPPQGCDSSCCEDGKYYPIYKCSPTVTNHTKATLKLRIFETNEDGGTPCECDGLFHRNKEHIVALSIGWFDKKSRCLNKITIHGNGKSVKAKVMDECNSTTGCDGDSVYQPPCGNNIVEGSKGVWKALGVPKNKWGNLEIYWSESDA